MRKLSRLGAAIAAIAAGIALKFRFRRMQMVLGQFAHASYKKSEKLAVSDGIGLDNRASNFRPTACYYQMQLS